jgi:predicted nucleotidyltransferase
VTPRSRACQRLNADGIRQRARGALEREPGIAVAWLFGSAARGRMGVLSDIDIAYVCFPGQQIDQVRVGAVLEEVVRRFMDARPLVEDQIDGLRNWIRAL